VYGTLSRPMGTAVSQCAIRAQSCISQWFSWFRSWDLSHRMQARCTRSPWPAISLIFYLFFPYLYLQLWWI